MSLRWLRRAWKRRIWMYVLRRFHPEVEIRLDSSRVVIDLRDRAIGRRLYLGGDYEPDLRCLMHHMGLGGSVCLDVGAHIGLHTIYLSQLAGSAGRVFAFEPEPRNFHLLQHNLRINGTTNVTSLRCALGDTEGTCRLLLNPKNYGDNRISAQALARWASLEVPITTVDRALSDVPAGAVAFAKIDVQGYECHVLRGMNTTLERNPDLILAIEVFPEALRDARSSPRELIQSLWALGFRGWEFSPHRLLPLPEPWVYELMRGGSVDIVASRNIERLNQVVADSYSHLRTQPFRAEPHAVTDERSLPNTSGEPSSR